MKIDETLSASGGGRFRGLRPPDPHQLYPWTLLGVLPLDPRYRLALNALAMVPLANYRSSPGRTISRFSPQYSRT